MPITSMRAEPAIERRNAGSGSLRRVGPYFTEVNKGSINMSTLTDKLNHRYSEGWRLHTIFEQHGNTVMVFESVALRAGS